MAVTHADIAPSRQSCDLGSKTGAFLMVLSILLGLCSFILCLISEATHSRIIWEASSGEGKGIKSECTYSSSGKIPLLSATGAFFALALAMVIQHTYLLVAVSKSDSLLTITWDPDSDFAKRLTWQAGFFFVATWASFAVGEILLLIGLSVESGHLKSWQIARDNCLIIRPGLFTAAGVFGLLTVSLAAGLYITALRAQTHEQDQENARREILEAAVLYASPPRSPARIQAVPSENPTARQDQNVHTLRHYLTALGKHSTPHLNSRDCVFNFWRTTSLFGEGKQNSTATKKTLDLAAIYACCVFLSFTINKTYSHLLSLPLFLKIWLLFYTCCCQQNLYSSIYACCLFGFFSISNCSNKTFSSLSCDSLPNNGLLPKPQHRSSIFPSKRFWQETGVQGWGLRSRIAIQLIFLHLTFLKFKCGLWFSLRFVFRRLRFSLTGTAVKWIKVLSSSICNEQYWRLGGSGSGSGSRN